MSEFAASTCPTCLKQFKIRTSNVGESGVCPSCQENIIVALPVSTKATPGVEKQAVIICPSCGERRTKEARAFNCGNCGAVIPTNADETRERVAALSLEEIYKRRRALGRQVILGWIMVAVSLVVAFAAADKPASAGSVIAFWYGLRLIVGN